MRYKVIRKILAAALVVVFAGFMQACDDGQHLWDGGDATISPPFVAITAEPMQVSKGGSTTLKFRVDNADSYIITADSTGDFAFNMEEVEVDEETTEVIDEMVVDGITATTTFTITAKVSGTASDDTGDLPPWFPSENLDMGVNVTKSGQIEIPEDEQEGDDADASGSAETPIEVSASVTVTVVDGGALTATFDADPNQIDPGDTSVLTWEVTPSHATTNVTASNGETITALDDCSAYISASSSGSKVGCAIVHPSEPATAYTLVAEDTSTGDSITLVDTVVVGGGGNDNGVDETASKITARDKDGVDQEGLAEVEGFSEKVLIKYNIVPTDVPVTVEALGLDSSTQLTPDADNCPLSVNETLTGGSKEVLCKIDEKTRFTLIGHGPKGDVVAGEVIVAAVGGGIGQILPEAQPWAFQGESISIKISPVTEADKQFISKVVVKGKDDQEFTDITEWPIIASGIVVPAGGVHVHAYSTRDPSVPSQMFNNLVRVMELKHDGKEGKRITEVEFDHNDADRSYYGSAQDMLLEGIDKFMTDVITLRRNDNTPTQGSEETAIPTGPVYVPVGLKITEWFNQGGSNMAGTITDDFWKHSVRIFDVQTITTRESNEIFVGTTGGILFSQDSGFSWDVFSGLFYTVSCMRDEITDECMMYQYTDKQNHETCRGELQPMNPQAEDGQISFFSRVCDAVIDDNRMYVATDYGVATYTDVDGKIADRHITGTVHYMARTEEEKARLKTKNHVASDLELAEVDNEKMLFAAMATGNIDDAMAVDGVFMSKETSGYGLGESWEELGSLDVDTYAVAVDAENKIIYAGTKDGIYKMDLSDLTSSWENIYTISASDSDTPGVFSLAVDPTSGLLIAGLADGAMVSRDPSDPNSWNVLDDLKGTGKAKVTMIAKKNQDDDLVDYRVAMGADTGFFLGTIDDADPSFSSLDDDDTAPPEDGGNDGNDGNEDPLGE